MVDRRDLGGWLGSGGGSGGGSGARRPAAGGANGSAAGDEWPGRRLGRPRSGPGSVAGVGRRLAGITVDWALALLVSAAFLGGDPWGTLGVFVLVQVLLVGTLGAAPGHALLGMRVERVGGGWAGPGRAAVRSFLLGLAVPALVWDRDQRGLHDRAAGTVLVRH